METLKMPPTYVDLAPRSSSTSKPSSNSVSGLISTLIPALILASIYVGLFLVFRVTYKRIYMPRTYLGQFSEQQKTPSMSSTKFGWIKDFRKLSDDYVLNHHSLDAYLLLRFWRMIIFVCACGWVFTWAVLMPVYGTSHGGSKQFDKVSYSNIKSSVDGNRLYAVVLVAWVFLGFVMFNIARESVHYVQLKQAFLLLPGIGSRMASRTVLFTNVPDEYLSEQRLRETFPSVKHVWISTDTKELQELIKDRDKTAMKLEGAEIKLSKNANNARLKAIKKNKNPIPEAREDPMHWEKAKKRPTHKLGFLGLFGKKVDTIEWSRPHLQEVIPKVEKMQASEAAGSAKLMSAVFIEFDDVHTAEAAYRQTQIQVPKQFESRAIATRPQEIIWKNLNMGKAQRKTRNTVVVTIIALMIIFWTPITAFIGALTNINSLTNKVHFLSFINKIPGPILGIVTGLLPTILLVVLLILVPIIMRLLFTLAGAASMAEVETKTQTWFFLFQVIQVFLVTTIASGASSAITQIISDPSSATTLLANDLPKASNFYVNYFVLYGLASASASILNVVAVLLFIILGKLLDNTPRKMFKRYMAVPGIGWGSFYPVYTNLTVIAFTYAMIAPLILAFATISFFLLYLVFRYQMLFSVDTLSINMQGRSFAKALQQLTTGVYLSEVCLIGLFGISTGSSSKAGGPLGLMVAFLVVTIIFHILANRTVAALEKGLTAEAGVVRQPDVPSKNEGEVPLAPLDKKGRPISGNSSGNGLGKIGSMMVKLLHPPRIPIFEQYLSSPIPEYDEVARNEAYLDPALSSPTPLLWLVQDKMGISEREKMDSSRYIGVTDDGAWWDEKTGKLVVTWLNQTESAEVEASREAPIYEEKVLY